MTLNARILSSTLENNYVRITLQLLATEWAIIYYYIIPISMRKFLKICSEWQTTNTIHHFGARNVDALIGYMMKMPLFPPPDIEENI